MSTADFLLGQQARANASKADAERNLADEVAGLRRDVRRVEAKLDQVIRSIRERGGAG